MRSEDFPAAFQVAGRSRSWAALQAPTEPTFPWDPDSTTLPPPPFASGGAVQLAPFSAQPLLVLGDDITTDHISPASAIPQEGLLADFLVGRGERRDDLGVLAARRGNWEAMVRGAFVNATMVNELAPEAAPGMTTDATGRVAPIFDVAEALAAQRIPAVVITGERYGMGSSRDWAAKAQHLLGVRAVLAASFERIHRTNLIGMGILPLVLPASERTVLGPIGAADRFVVDVDADSLRPVDAYALSTSRRVGAVASSLSRRRSRQASRSSWSDLVVRYP